MEVSPPMKMDLMTDNKSFFSMREKKKLGFLYANYEGCRAPCRVHVDAGVFAVKITLSVITNRGLFFFFLRWSSMKLLC